MLVCCCCFSCDHFAVVVVVKSLFGLECCACFIHFWLGKRVSKFELRMSAATATPPPAAASGPGLRPDGSKRIVEEKKYTTVAMWSWDVQVDNCAICKNNIADLCIDCQQNHASGQACDCPVAFGVCNHAFHQHCISRWLKTRQTCPLCDREWEMTQIVTNN